MHTLERKKRKNMLTWNTKLPSKHYKNPNNGTLGLMKNRQKKKEDLNIN